MSENIEPTKPKNDSDLIFGVNQAHEGFVEPEFVLPVDEQGNSLQRKLPKESVVITHYWVKKKKTISAIGAISALAIVAILVQETGIFDTIFQTLTNLFVLGLNYFLGLFL